MVTVAVIGAGAAGLASARHVSAQGLQCEVYEMGEEIGGTWVYSDSVEEDKYGYPVHSAMYENLRANLPKEVMGFPDFPIPQQEISYLPQKDILEFLNLYTDHFKLRRLIKFNEMVTEIRPEDLKWRITSIHKPTKKESVSFYDYVMICNGHYHTPYIKNIPGEEHFQGRIMHSHQYRKIAPFKNQKILVIGAGYSGFDIAFQVSKVAAKVIISQRPNCKEVKGFYPVNITKKPEVVCVKNDNQIEFTDNSREKIDVIIHCTGYKYSFPFLHESCGITIKDNHIQPLYKQIINIKKPRMCFVGLPFYVCAFQMFDLQARFYCQYMNGSMSLPPADLMYENLEEDVKRRKEKGLSSRYMHLLGEDQQEYFDDLARCAHITPIPAVISQIWVDSDDNFYEDLAQFRDYKYRIVNNCTFVKRRI